MFYFAKNSKFLRSQFWRVRWMVDYGGAFIAKILFWYFSDMNILGLKFSCKNSHFSAHKIIKVTVNSKWFINAKSYKYIWIDKLEGYLMIFRNVYIWVDLYICLWFVAQALKVLCTFGKSWHLSIKCHIRWRILWSS